MNGKIVLLILLSVSIILLNLSANDFLEQAFVFHKERKFDQAEKSYLQALESGANQTIVSYNLANLYYQKGEISRAIPLYQRVIDQAPKFKNAYLNLGKVFFINEEYVRALEVFLDFYKLVPGDWDNLILLGDTFKRMEINDKAFNFYEKARLLEPGREDTYIILTEFYLDLLDKENALYYLDLAKENKIISLKIEETKGDIFFEEEEYFRAINVYNDLLSNEKYNLNQEQEYSIRSKIVNCLLSANISQLAINNLKSLIIDYGKVNDLIKIEDLLQKQNKLKDSFDFYSEVYQKNPELVYPFLKNLFILAYNQENTMLLDDIISFYEEHNLKDEVYNLAKYEEN